MTTLPRGASARLTLLAAVTAALVGFAPERLHAAAPANLKLEFSDRANDPDPQPLLLRPTVQQQLFVYVQNTADEDQKDLTVQVLADGVAVAATAQPFTAKGKKVTPVDFSKAAAAPAAPPAPPAAPAVKPAPPALEEAKGRLVVQIFDKDLKPIGDAQVLEVKPPSEYIDLDLKATSFDPGTGNGTNKLTVKVTTESQFPGPVCRVELVLLGDRIPGLQPSPRKPGSRAGYISKAKMVDGQLKASTLTLTAENLDLKPGAEGGSVNGLVYLTIDGWERAYTLQTTFPAKGDATTPLSIGKPMVRLVASPFADPASPYPVHLEADKIGSQVLELGFDRGGDMMFREENNEIVKFTGDRRVHMLFSAAGPGGSLLLQPQVEDWKTDLDVTGIDGPRALRVRVLNNEGKADDFWGAAPLEFGKPKPDQPADPLGSLDNKLFFTVQLNGSEPQGIQLYFPDKPIKRGGPLKVQATTTDKADEIDKVFFYLGKPGPDGKPPANVEMVTGVKHLVEKEVVWAADLPAATDTKGKVDVTVQFVKFNNLAQHGTATVTLEEPPAAAATGPQAPKVGSIVGEVYQGGSVVKSLKDPKDPKSGEVLKLVDERPQQNIEVRLLDDKGAVKDVTRTDGDGKYEFKNLPPGSYKVTAAKTNDSTKGDSAALVVDGPTTANVQLTR